MKTLILAGAILAAGGLVAAGVAGRFSEDIGVPPARNPIDTRRRPIHDGLQVEG
jgi:hypothetical protein